MNAENNTDQVNIALDQVKQIRKLRSDRQLALMLDLEKQNVAAWRSKGEVPANRAVQLELITKNKVTWKMLCPRLLQETLELIDR